jgi:hypothetical protein
LKHYRNPNTNEVFAYDSEEERSVWGAPELVEMTNSELEKHLSPKVIVPQTVSRFQARAALLGAGLLEQVETMMESADPLAKLAWQEGQEVRRNSPLVRSMAQALQLSDEQLDDLFIQAAMIEA